MLLEGLNFVNLATVFIFLIVFYLSWKLFSRRHLPPGPWGYPILGSIPRFDLRKISTFRKLRKQYGDLYTLTFGQRNIVVVNGYDALREVFVKHGDKTSDRPSNYSFDVLNKKSGVIASSGTDWINMRSFSLSALRDFGFGKRSLQSRVIEEVENVLQEVEKNVDKPFNIRHLLQISVSNIICSIVFGERYDYKDPEFIQQMNDMDEALRLNSAGSALNSFPILKYLPGDMFNIKRFQFLVNRQNRRNDALIDAHRKTHNPEEPRDYIDTILTANKSMDWFRDDHVRVSVRELFVAGTDTTATTLRWDLLYFTFYPEVQNQLWREIDDVIGISRLLTIEDKQNMPYCEAVITETLRLGNTVPLSLPHATSCDLSIRGFEIPKGTMLLPATASYTTDPDVFPEPERFNPGRFLDENGKLTGHEKVLAFSLGRRVCLGESLARMELFLFITSLVQRFRFRMEDENNPPSLTGTLGIVNAPRQFNMIISKR